MLLCKLSGSKFFISILLLPCCLSPAFVLAVAPREHLGRSVEIVNVFFSASRLRSFSREWYAVTLRFPKTVESSARVQSVAINNKYINR